MHAHSCSAAPLHVSNSIARGGALARARGYALRARATVAGVRKGQLDADDCELGRKLLGLCHFFLHLETCGVSDALAGCT